MSQLVICAATEIEAQVAKNLGLPFFIHGPGIPSTILKLQNFLFSNKDILLLQIGICGAYPASDLAIGDVVRVNLDCFADLGTETDSGSFEYLSPMVPESGRFIPDSQPSFFVDRLKSLSSIVALTGASVNCCSGTDHTASQRAQMFKASVETMEGAAFFWVAHAMGCPAIQIRAVSNQAGLRNKTQWNIPMAIQSLEKFLKDQI
jgi:futalosine hydrolase